MSAASLNLLKGANKDGNLDQGKTAPAGAQESEDEATIEVDGMSSEELDGVVAEFGVETPKEWSGWGAEEKRAWLKTQFDDAGEPTDSKEEPAAAAAPAQDAKQEKKAKKSGKAKAQAAAPAEPAAAPAAKQKAKKPPSKALEKSTLVTGEVQVQGDDLMFDLVYEIETMKEQDARSLVGKLAEETELTFFKLGGVLSVIQSNGWFAPYPSFRDYVEKEHGLHYRKASYWVAIYNALVDAKVPWEKVKELGWTKLKEIAPVLNPDNVDEWVEIAKANNTLSLIETVKKSQAKNAPVALEDKSAKSVTTKTFKCHEGQKEVIEAAIGKAKKDSGAGADTAALELICGDYISAPTLAGRLKQVGIEVALAAVEQAFPDAKIEVTLGEDENEAA